MAQLMKYHQHPTSGIGEIGFSIKIDDGSWETWYTRGGDGTGGQYNWADMVLDPNCTNYSDESWQAIGALCYDAGLSVNMNYTAAVSLTDTLRAKNALTTIFNYGNAIKGFNSISDIGAGLTNMINPNLDAKDPVLLGITGPSGGHAVVSDGYGYTSSVLYHHLNMGWSGTDDAWYNLPTINSSPSFNSIYKCVYNIHVDGAGDGEIISGRVFDSLGQPIPNPIVYAEPDQGQPTLIAAESNNKGVYGIKLLDSNKQYTVYPVVDGYIFTPQQITTGTSTDYANTSGNVSGVDFYGDVDESFYLGDFEPDGDIDWDDIQFFCSHWLETGCSDLAGDQTDWCYATDINHDQTVNYYDFAEFAPNWLAGTQ